MFSRDLGEVFRSQQMAPSPNTSMVRLFRVSLERKLCKRPDALERMRRCHTYTQRKRSPVNSIVSWLHNHPARWNQVDRWRRPYLVSYKVCSAKQGNQVAPAHRFLVILLGLPIEAFYFSFKIWTRLLVCLIHHSRTSLLADLVRYHDS